MVTLGTTVCVSGIRRSLPGETFTVCWYVRSTLVDGLGERVDYTITANGVPHSSGSATVRGIVKPDFSDVDSPLPGVPSGQAPFDGYAVTLDLASLPAGVLVVDAVAIGDDGSTHTLESVTVYNDTDGTDRRPSSKVVYCDADLGNDSNDGSSWALAVKTRHRAMGLARANPSGSTSADLDVGGATINMRGTFTDGDPSGSAPQCHTSGEHWLTFIAHDGCKWNRTDPLNSVYATDFLYFVGHGLGPCQVKIRLQGLRIEGNGAEAWADADVTFRAWLEGGDWGSAHWVAGQTRALYAEDDNGSWMGFGGSPLAALPNMKHFVTGSRRRGGILGFNGDSFVYDCEIRDTLGGNLYIQNSWEKRCKNVSLNCHGHSHLRNTTPGWGANKESLGSPEALEAQNLGSGVMRILGPVAGLDFGTALADNVGSSICRLGIYGWTGNNTSAAPILGGGVVSGGPDDGRPYVDILHSGVYGAAPGGAEIETTIEGQRFNERIHPSFFSIGTSRIGDDMIADVACSNMTEQVQSAFANGNDGADHDRLLIWNVRDAGTGANWSFGLSSITNSLIGNVSAPTSGFLLTGSEDWTGTQMVNCVWKDMPSDTPTAITNGLSVLYCHVVTGSTYGSNPSSGTWLENDPAVSPFSYEPTAGNKGTGHPSVTDPAAWAYDGGGSTKGCLSNVGEVSWALTTPTDVFGSALGSVALYGLGSSSSVVSGSAVGSLGLYGVSALFVDVPTLGDAHGSVPLWGHSTAASAISGQGNGILGLWGVASSASPISSTGSGGIGLFGDSVATVGQMIATAGGWLGLWGQAGTFVASDDGGNPLFFTPVYGQADGIVGLWGSSQTFSPAILMATSEEVVQITANGARIVRAPGRIVIAPIEDLATGSFPFGGREIGRANLCVLRPVGEQYRVTSEGTGETSEILEAGNSWVWSCFLRGWNDTAIELLMQDSYALGEVSQHALLEVPGSQYAGRSALGRAVKLLFVPDDHVHAPAVILYRAVPDWSSSAELQFRRGEELGMPLTFECLRDGQDRILKVGRLVDLTL